MFNRWFLMRVSRTDRLRFFQSYCRERGLSEVAKKAISLEEATWASNQRFWLSRDERCLKRNRYFKKVRSRGVTGFAVQEMDATFLKNILAHPDALFDRADVRKLKDSRSSTVIELEVPTPSGSKSMIFKRFRVTSLWDGVANFFRRSPTLHSWQMGHGLRDRGLPSPRPWLVLHRSRWGLKREGYLLCEKIIEARELQVAVEEIAKLELLKQREAQRNLLDSLARLIRDLHQRQLAHRDLKAANLLVTGDLEQEFQLHFIDLVGVRRQRKLSPFTRRQNLTRLHASFVHNPFLSRTDRLRFLFLYLNVGLYGVSNWKDWWKSISEATQAKIERNNRRGRPLA